jgi:site-specific DNA recombinase
VKCSICGGNLVITSGRSRRGHRRYGCSQHFYRGVCPNGVQIRKDLLEENLLGGLKDSVLKPEVVKYAVEEFSRQLEKSDSNLSHEMDRAAEKKRTVEAELNRLVAAVADGGHSASLLKATEQKEQELQTFNEQLQAFAASPQHVQPADITSFVINRLAVLRDLLKSDVTQARAELLMHVTEIRLCPKRMDAGTDYVAVGEWNLFGNFPEMDRARHFQGVRARLVAGA